MNKALLYVFFGMLLIGIVAAGIEEKNISLSINNQSISLNVEGQNYNYVCGISAAYTILYNITPTNQTIQNCGNLTIDYGKVPINLSCPGVTISDNFSAMETRLGEKLRGDMDQQYDSIRTDKDTVIKEKESSLGACMQAKEIVTGMNAKNEAKLNYTGELLVIERDIGKMKDWIIFALVALFLLTASLIPEWLIPDWMKIWERKKASSFDEKFMEAKKIIEKGEPRTEMPEPEVYRSAKKK